MHEYATATYFNAQILHHVGQDSHAHLPVILQTVSIYVCMYVSIHESIIRCMYIQYIHTVYTSVINNMIVLNFIGT